MLLADGRRIVPSDDVAAYQTDAAGEEQQQVIRLHPDFRMVVLANRPGFPFLGNDFFGALGDLFGCHAIDNPGCTDSSHAFTIIHNLIRISF